MFKDHVFLCDDKADYQKMIDLGGEIAIRGYQGQVETYRDAKMFDEATAICRKAVAANPDSRELKLTLAAQLADTGKLDEGIALANSLLTGKPADREVYLQISQIQLRLKHWKEAEDALAKAEPFATKDTAEECRDRLGRFAELRKYQHLLLFRSDDLGEFPRVKRMAFEHDDGAASGQY